MAGSKTRLAGQILELEFSLECIKRGATVSQPFGDNSHYDLLVDDGTSIHKVQVKKASKIQSASGYRVNITRKLPKMRPSDPGGSSRAVPYEDGDIDCIVTKAGGIWFFFGPDMMDKDKVVYPHAGREEYAGNAGREMRHMIGLEFEKCIEPDSP